MSHWQCLPIYLVSYLVVLKPSENNWLSFEVADCFVLLMIFVSVFYTIHNQSLVISACQNEGKSSYFAQYRLENNCFIYMHTEITD